jgi:hypothetical protein
VAASVLCLTVALGAVVPGASPLSERVAHAAEPADKALAGGVVVVALPGATDAAWPIARALYGKHGLLPPGLTDAEARTLAGESVAAPTPVRRETPTSPVGSAGAESSAPASATTGTTTDRGASARLVELARLRDEVEKPATRHAALADLVRLTRARGAIIVGTAAGITVTRTYAAESKLIADALTSPSDQVDIDKIAQEARSKTGPKPAGSSLLRSPWTWAAVGAAAVLGTVIYFSSKRDTGSDTVPLRLATDR